MSAQPTRADQCSYTNCTELRASACEECNRNFCADHGTASHDRDGGSNPNGSPHGAYAVPSACWMHGGFNVDE